MITDRYNLINEKVNKLQDFEIPKHITDKTYTRITKYMKHHPNYLKLSTNAMVVLDYMKDVAFDFFNEEYLIFGTFDFSVSYVVDKLKIMSIKTARNAINELQHYGFIEKVNNTGLGKGFTSKWRFSNKWQYENNSKLDRPHDKNKEYGTDFYFVYLHTLPNEKKYYGITSMEQPNGRWKDGNGYISNKLFYEDILKYGWNNVKHDILYDGLSYIEAICYEYALILRDKTYKYENGYNHSNTKINTFIKEHIKNETDYYIFNDILNKVLNLSIEEVKNQ